MVTRPARPAPRTLVATLRETAALLRLAIDPRRSDPARVYDLLSTHNHLGESSLFLNLGYWAEARDFDGACAALATLVGEHAGLAPGDVVLDAGCGYGDQDVLWAQRFSPAKIVALNVTASQIALARERTRDDRIEYVHGSATAIPCEASAFDVVIALESAFHFQTREDFFREACRVLRPGGRIVLADVVSRAMGGGPLQRAMEWVGRGMWQAPSANLYDQDEYVRRMERAGFGDVRVTDISAHVFAPFKAYAQRRLQDPEVRARVNPILRAVWSAPHEGMRRSSYLIFAATKAKL